MTQDEPTQRGARGILNGPPELAEACKAVTKFADKGSLVLDSLQRLVDRALNWFPQRGE